MHDPQVKRLVEAHKRAAEVESATGAVAKALHVRLEAAPPCDYECPVQSDLRRGLLEELEREASEWGIAAELEEAAWEEAEAAKLSLSDLNLEVADAARKLSCDWALQKFVPGCSKVVVLADLAVFNHHTGGEKIVGARKPDASYVSMHGYEVACNDVS
eukprot:CAMPEP_0115861500 /NCGR_PEP_ID=MMETSP0287-20121206/17684_1 /TAXON_ID=412157 /ORGANISM="Chrysochromulina rotalis, Strain UIO044" /LENGTH=158 /DNA_ID=CAMNT_0003315875 /DNA_START=197 /DNA_END=674 /DNA_ORIENTATION=+